MKLFLTLAMIISAAFLTFTITPNGAFAKSINLDQTISNGPSSIAQSSQGTTSDPSAGLLGLSNIANGLSSVTPSSIQTTTCTSDTLASNSCHQIGINFNIDNTISSTFASNLAVGLLGLSNIANGLSSTMQSSTQTSSVPSGGSTTSSSNHLVVNSDQSNPVSHTEASSTSP